MSIHIDNGNWNGELKLIQELVCRAFLTTYSGMLSKRRHKENIPARHVAMWLCRKLTRASFPEIGRAFNRDHTTIIHGIKNAQRFITTDEDINKTVACIIDQWGILNGKAQ